MRKIIILVLSFLAIILIGFYVYTILIAIASQKMPQVEITPELKKLESDIQKETYSGVGTFFEPIPEYEIENCNANFSLHIYLKNDSLTQSKEILDNYINSVSKRVNEKLVDKKCIDSLLIEVSSYYSKEKVDSLKIKKYRYSFPIK
jgi:hypothetical protein